MGCCPLPCEKFSNIPGLWPLDASRTAPSHLPALTAPNVSRYCQMSLGGGWGTKSSPIEKHCLKPSHGSPSSRRCSLRSSDSLGELCHFLPVPSSLTTILFFTWSGPTTATHQPDSLNTVLFLVSMPLSALYPLPRRPSPPFTIFSQLTFFFFFFF